MNHKLKQMLKKHFEAPAPQNQTLFLSSLDYPKLSMRKALLIQAGYIRRRVWIVFAVLLVAAFVTVNYVSLDEHKIGILSAFLPMFALVSSMEIYKSTICGMDEMELACKYSLPCITLMRFSIMGIAGMAILFGFVLLLGGMIFDSVKNCVYLSVPYLFSVNISLKIITKIKDVNAVYLCFIVCFGVSGGIFLLQMLYQNIYAVLYSTACFTVWVAALIVLILVLKATYVKFQKSQEEILWSCA